MRSTFLLIVAAAVLTTPTAFAEDAGPVSVNVDDCSNNAVAVSVNGCAVGLVAVSAQSFARSDAGVAVSGASEANGHLVAVSATRDAYSAHAAYGHRAADADFVAVSPSGSARTANWVAVSVLGVPYGSIAVSGFGPAYSAGLVSARGCCAEGGLATASPERGAHVLGSTILEPLPASACW